MSKRKEQKKKVVVTTNTQKKKTVKTQSSSPKAKAKSSRATTVAQRSQAEFTLNSENFKWMGIGIVLIVVGMVLMGGGQMPSPDVWDDNIIYGFRRTVLAPIVILAGLALQVFAIFKKS